MGKSTKAGPPWGASAAANASSTRPGISAVLSGVTASFVSGRTKGTWSISCSEPCPQRIAGALPPSTTIGEWLACAEAMALIPLVTPGPAVSAHTPGSRVNLRQPNLGVPCFQRKVAAPHPRQRSLAIAARILLAIDLDPEG